MKSAATASVLDADLLTATLGDESARLIREGLAKKVRGGFILTSEGETEVQQRAAARAEAARVRAANRGHGSLIG